MQFTSNCASLRPSIVKTDAQDIGMRDHLCKMILDLSNIEQINQRAEIDNESQFKSGYRAHQSRHIEDTFNRIEPS